jgi:hypothetical protein
MRSRAVVWAVAALLVATATFAQLSSDDCAANRGLVRNGKVGGPPGDPASARNITFAAFQKIVYPNAADSSKWPSKVAPKGRVTGEGILYRIDNLDIRTFANCHDAIAVEFGEFRGAPGTFQGLFPASACLSGTWKDVVAAARSVYTDQLSVWGADLWANTFVKNCVGQTGGDGKFDQRQRVSIIGYSFWNDSGGASAPRLSLAPMIAIIDTSDGVGNGGNGGNGNGGNGGNGGTGGTPPPTSTGLAVVLPDDVRATPVVMANSSSTSVLFSTFASSSSTSAVSVSAQSDADDLIASVNHPVIAAPGSGDEILTIRTTSTTTAGDHVVTITADDGTTTSSASVFVTVLCDPPFILGIDQPKGSTVSAGRPAQLSVKASGSGPVTYQWFTGASGLTNFPLPGGTSANFTTSALNDTTSYWVRITNPCGSVNSQTATVNVAASAKPNARR